MIVIDPMLTSLAAKAALWLQVRPGDVRVRVLVCPRIEQHSSMLVFPPLRLKGNMADPGEVDEVGIMHRVDVFMYAHGHKRLGD
jgi:hypothetical protein